MTKQTLFSIKFDTYKFKIAESNPNLSVCNFDEKVMIDNVKSILGDKLKIKSDTSLIYHFDKGVLNVSGIAEDAYPDAPLIL